MVRRTAETQASSSGSGGGGWSFTGRKGRGDLTHPIQQGDLQRVAATRVEREGGTRDACRVEGESHGHDAAAARQRLALDAALVGADLQLRLRTAVPGDEIDVGALRPERWVEPDRPGETGDIAGRHGWEEQHEVRRTHVYEPPRP